MSRQEINREIKEVDGLLLDKSTMEKCITGNVDSLISHKDQDKQNTENKECENVLEIETFKINSTTIETSDSTKLFRLKKIIGNKSLFTFRIAQFLWYGAGAFPRHFMTIFLIQQGLTLQSPFLYVSIFFGFFFQFICAIITGVITDKIGNAKPVLMFLMISTSFILIVMSLIPNINAEKCIELKEMSDFFKSKSRSSCYNTCLSYSKNQNQFLETDSENYGDEYSDGDSIHKNFRIDAIKFDRTPCNILLSNMSLNSFKYDCCEKCLDNIKTECVTERDGYLVTVYVCLLSAFSSVWTTTYRFLDFTAVSLAIKNDSHYGKEQIFAVSGNLVTIILIAIVLTLENSSGLEINYKLVIQISACISFCAFLALFATSVPIQSPGKNLWKKALSLVKNIDMLAYFLAVFIAGNGFTFHLNFNIRFLELLNAPFTVIVLHLVAIVLYGFIILLTSNWWLTQFGTSKIFVLALLFYAIHLGAYSFLYNTWWCLIIDACAALNFQLFWVAVVVHCHSVAPVDFSATLNAFIGAVHFVIGRLSGLFCGGMMMSHMEPRKVYRICAAVFFVAALLYSIFLSKRRKSVPINSLVYGDKNNEEEHSTNIENQVV